MRSAMRAWTEGASFWLTRRRFYAILFGQTKRRSDRMTFQLIKDSPVALHERTNSTARFLTSEETIEMARIQKDESVIGYALLSLNGEEIESSGA